MIVLPPTALTRMSIAPNSWATDATSEFDLGRVERIGAAPVRPPAGRAQPRHGRVEPARVIVDGNHDAPFARHDIGGGAPDPARRRSDDRHLVGKAHC